MQSVFRASKTAARLAALCVLSGSAIFAQEASILESNTNSPNGTLPPPEAVPAANASTDLNTAPAGVPDLPTSETRTEELTESTEYGYEVLLQGPVHEAFAIASEELGEVSGQVVAQEPPPPVNEQPPELEQPAGNKQWVPGYWAWNDELSKYVWVSGLWREVPPGRQWIAGYWERQSNGYRWVSGYWQSATVSAKPLSTGLADYEYLPAPPASIDNGPSSLPPRTDTFWLPGQWVYDGSTYVWQSGYWSQQHDNWIWQPACYVDTPRGYVHVSGYWDYEPEVRGVCYAPVVFSNNVYRRPNYVFRPVYRLGRSAAILLHMFRRPGNPWYYYGNYYGDHYTRLGYRPWYSLQPRGYAASPLLNYYDWKYRRYGIAFSDSMSRYQNYYRSAPVNRPSPRGGPQSQRPSFVLQDALTSNVSNFDQIVRRELAGQSPKRIASMPPSSFDSLRGPSQGSARDPRGNNSRGNNSGFGDLRRSLENFDPQSRGNPLTDNFRGDRMSADAAARQRNSGGASRANGSSFGLPGGLDRSSIDPSQGNRTRNGLEDRLRFETPRSDSLGTQRSGSSRGFPPSFNPLSQDRLGGQLQSGRELLQPRGFDSRSTSPSVKPNASDNSPFRREGSSRDLRSFSPGSLSPGSFSPGNFSPGRISPGRSNGGGPPSFKSFGSGNARGLGAGKSGGSSRSRGSGFRSGGGSKRGDESRSGGRKK